MNTSISSNFFIKKPIHLSLIPLITLSINLTGCSTLKQNHSEHHQFVKPSQSEHPASQTFIKYSNAVEQATAFNDVLPFFSAHHQKTIEKSIGWARKAYTSSYTVLKNGHCNLLDLTNITASRATIFCKGEYRFKPIMSEEQDFPMQMKVTMQKVGEEWFIGKSGFFYESGQGESASRPAKGLKFEPHWP